MRIADSHCHIVSSPDIPQLQLRTESSDCYNTDCNNCEWHCSIEPDIHKRHLQLQALPVWLHKVRKSLLFFSVITWPGVYQQEIRTLSLPLRTRTAHLHDVMPSKASHHH